MIFTKIALALGVLVLGFMVWLALVGVHAAGEALVTLIALVVLVGGGNLISGRRPRGRAADLEPRPISQWRTAAAPAPADADRPGARAPDAPHGPDAPRGPDAPHGPAGTEG